MVITDHKYPEVLICSKCKISCLWLVTCSLFLQSRSQTVCPYMCTQQYQSGTPWDSSHTFQTFQTPSHMITWVYVNDTKQDVWHVTWSTKIQTNLDTGPLVIIAHSLGWISTLVCSCRRGTHSTRWHILMSLEMTISWVTKQINFAQN